MSLPGVQGYRLVKHKRVDSAFDGEGARIFGGRWNSKGQPCVYLASSESLAILEIMVHINDYSLLKQYALIELTLPVDGLSRLASEDLPEDWQEEPAPQSTAAIGDTWLNGGENLALVVPSVVVPREDNFLLNTEHPSFKDVIAQAQVIDFNPDPRI